MSDSPLQVLRVLALAGRADSAHATTAAPGDCRPGAIAALAQGRLFRQIVATV